VNAKKHNIQMIEIVASGFKDLLPDVVFVGGATITLYLFEQATASESSVRPTDDVDCVVEVASRSDYNKLEKKIRALGFRNSIEQGAPVCRWIYSGVTVDIMPADPKIIGFSNKWYKAGIENAVSLALPSGLEIRIFSIPYFLASKMEAFKGRGKNDFLGSRDFEDIVTLIDGRENIQRELFESPEEVKMYLRNQFQVWAINEDFLQSISAHLSLERRNADGARLFLDIVRNF
jgi:predicted nucleotidyltransferase